MTLFLKVLHGVDTSPVDSDNPHTVYGDIVSCSFRRHGDRAEAVVYVREPVKTALVPGFCENEKLIDLCGPAYLMNEQGRTISSFTPFTSGDPRGTKRLTGIHSAAKPHDGRGPG